MENLDPAKLDVDLLAELFERYGNERLTGARIRAAIRTDREHRSRGPRCSTSSPPAG